MADVKISDMTPDASIGGSEIIPCSDAESPKSVTPTGLKNFTVDAIEAISAAVAVDGDDSVFILQGGVLKPVDIDLVAQHAIDTIWAKAAETDPDGADVLIVKDGATTEKTVTLTYLAAYVLATIEASILNVSDLADGSGTLAGTDYLLVTQGTTGKQVTLSDINTAIYAALKAYVVALDAVTTSVDSDVFYCVQGGVEKKVTLAEISTYLGDPVAGPSSTTPNSVPQWSNATGGLKDGLPVSDEVGSPGSGSSLVTEQAIRTAITAIAYPYETIWVPAKNMFPSSTAGADMEDADYSSNVMTHVVALFAGLTADENAEFTLVLPEEWNLGTIKAKVYWAPGDSAANVGEFVRFSLAAGALSNDDAIDTALGSAQTMDDAVIADDDMHVTPASAAITIAGTPALNDLIHFKLTRDYDYAGAGTAMDVDARVFGVLIQYKRATVAAAW